MGRRPVHSAGVALGFGVLLSMLENLRGFAYVLLSGDGATSHGLGLVTLVVAAPAALSAPHAKWREKPQASREATPTVSETAAPEASQI